MSVSVCVHMIAIYCTMHLLSDGKCVSDGDVWNLNPEERKQLVYASLQQKYREALEKLKCYLKEYNQVKDKYEVIIFSK